MIAAASASSAKRHPEREALPARRPLKLIIQIPCFNEEECLPGTLASLPRRISGIDTIEWLVVNDGSTDRTAEVARACGADHILDLPMHEGLARAFTAGLHRAAELGADIIVNTDADNQYDARDIPALIAPILERRAQLVVGERSISEIASFSRPKRMLQKIGSRIVRLFSGTDVMDAPSGFRAFTWDAALRLNVFDAYTYTLETLIEAGLTGMRVVSVPISVNDDPRPSRLVRSNLDYVTRSARTVLRAFLVYQPGRAFFLLGLLPMLVAFLLILRWFVLSIAGAGGTHVPSLIAAAIAFTLAALLWVCGLLGELFAINRRLLQDILYRLRRDRAEHAAGSLMDREDGRHALP